MSRRISLFVLLIVLLSGCGTNGAQQEDDRNARSISLPSTTVVDLTHPFNDETIYWPTAEGFQREVTAEGVTEQGYFYAAGMFSSAEHGGTHIDAPIHFAEGGQAVDEIPVDRLIGPSVVIDVSEHASANPDYQITVNDIRDWEIEHRPIPDGTIVFFRTGLGAFWPDRLRYLGTDQQGVQAIAELQFPGLDPDAAEWLVENRNVLAVGIDTPSIDYGQSQLFETHQVLAGDNISVLENVANLELLPEEGGVVVALPMKIEGGSGGPVRIIAFVP